MKLINRKKIYTIIVTTIVSIVMLYFVYLLRLPIAVGSLVLYTKLHTSPYIERLIGEFYLSLSHKAGQYSNKYFKLSLDKYLYVYKHYDHNNKDKQEYHLLEYLIGNSYECGKGTKKDLTAAKYWYQKAAEGMGPSQAQVALDRINSLIEEQ
jgi:TPR repeat protein